VNESIVKRIFEKHASDSKLTIIKNVPIEDDRIDYEIVSGGKRFAVEAKGTRSDEYSTIGQLLNIKKTYSNIYLLAPLNFIKKVWKTLQETNNLTGIGIMTIGEKGVHVLKKPSPETYYYNQPVKLPKKSMGKQMFINEKDIVVETKINNKNFIVSDVAKILSIPMTDAYHRVARLKSAGMIEEVSFGGHPKTYRFVKSRKKDEVISL